MTALLAAAAAGIGGVAAVELGLLVAGRAASPSARWPSRGRGSRSLARRVRVPAPDDLRARIDSARLGPAVDVRLVMGVKILLAAGTGSAIFALASLSLGGPTVVLLLAVPAASFLAPDAYLGWRARRVRAAVAAEAPDVADRLHMAVAGGLAPVRAVAVACAPGGGPLASELSAAADAAGAGIPLASALERVVGRCPGAEVRSLSAALVRSQRQGTDIASFLEELALDSRRRQALLLRDRAQKAAPKIQLAVALLLVPAAMALIAAALASGLFSA